ncbi:hypothetical protein KXW98_004974 [Aspergillus fumigatus]|jgi:hypothetical protein|uniref:Uncharacterized protein n=1 Tax=Aspergillus fumigatus (strain CBS 144.89 / FGSC A1163 / CEA10) TaxID=451804 RepID=B0XNM0_ASPFC|nr:conserved hypothetical protein [Aspergillus fumigatus A1163]KAF4270729.1 hypothetical protein CNMCM8812_000955 [Aspergillus fumigatus]KMK57306.1 hypothetical protein Y699_06847 [Aspergillus fumigatus Z5]KAF4280589.1 hypothetical protein CNMCM8689_001791 [Aspergillus fumigatus]KAH1271898.1 hypothetical protein KXX45_000390 [Aspergillus fumigatus]
MGNKVSAIHGVKSDHFYEKGNGINEIWIGDVELISRLPFGDSDLAQAAWPIGGWPKIPWHNFIIPLKRRALSAIESFSPGNNEHHQMSKRAAPDSGPPFHLSRVSLIVAVSVLSSMFMVAIYLPIFVRRHTASSGSSWQPDIARRREQTRRFATRAGIATMALAVSLVIAILQVHIWTLIRFVFAPKSAKFQILEVLWIAVGCVGLFYSVKAVTLLWLDLRDARRAAVEESPNVSNGVIEKQLPAILVSWLERRRRP